MPNYQQTSAPYSADVQLPHDDQITGWKQSFVRIFGTNVNPSVGDPYNASAEADIAARINARMGMLEVEIDESQNTALEWRGRTFEFPDWSQVPINNFTGVAYRTLFARILFDGNDFGEEEIAFVMGGSGLVGAVPAVPLGAVVLRRAPAVLPAVSQFSLDLRNYPNGGAFAPILDATITEWGQQVYLRVQFQTDNKDSAAIVWVSHDGISWLRAGSLFLSGFEYRRCGLALRSPGNEDEFLGRLDWVRLYDMPDANQDSFDTTEAISEVVAATGGRLFNSQP